MRRLSVRVLGLLVILLLLPAASPATNAVSEEHGGLLHELETDEYWYQLWEPVSIRYKVTNVTDEPIEIGFYCGDIFIDIFDPAMDPVAVFPTGVTGEAWVDILEPGEFYLRQPVWDMTDMFTPQWDPIEEPGIYTLRGSINTWNEELQHAVYLQILITEVPAEVSGEPISWGVIKALFH